ncbi:hypothetical protein MKX07_000358 [Trichoderma sp. CBMAI-0711]|nr:hypothetical protein MKX07_000358 [Trichoderma sp. CBMAI-0711]
MTSSQALIRTIVGTSSRASWNAHSPILQLPPEMILCIADHLDLQDLFILSQVCRAFWHLVHRDWNGELFRLRPWDQYRFWVGPALIRPAFWACGRCCRMHRVIVGPDIKGRDRRKWILDIVHSEDATECPTPDEALAFTYQEVNLE